MIKSLQLIRFSIILLLLTGSVAVYSQNHLQTKARRIHKKVFTIDSHTDTPMNLTSKGFDVSVDNSLINRRSKVDFPRMRKGGLNGIFFAVFESQGPRTPEGNLKSKQHALITFDSIFSNLKRYHEQAESVTTPKQAYRLKKQGKLAVFIGMENGYPIGNDLENINLFYRLGARYITLCHTANNDICTSSTDTNNVDKGLSEFGVKVVREMNRLGMMVDVSHISDRSFYDVLKVTKVSVIASHSCSRAICDNPRNMTDDMLKALAANGGVVQMCILSAYVKKSTPNLIRDSVVMQIRNKYGSSNNMTEEQRKQYYEEMQAVNEKYPQQLANVQDVCNHIDHMVKIAGIDHVGIGTDFDGGGGVDGCNDVSQIGNITLELVKRGYTKSEIRKIWGGNLMRVLKQVEDYGAAQQKTNS